MTTNKDYDAYMEEVVKHSGDAFLRVRFDYIYYFDGNFDAAIVLSFVLNHLYMKSRNDNDRQRLQKNDMWFKCPAGEIQDRLMMLDGRRRRAFDLLIKDDLIETDRRLGNILWIRVKTDNLKGIGEVAKVKKEKSGSAKMQKPQNAETVNCGDLILQNGVTDSPKSENPYVKNPSQKLSNKPCRPPSRDDGVIEGSPKVEDKSSPDGFSSKDKPTTPSASVWDDMASRLYSKLHEKDLLGSNDPRRTKKTAASIKVKWSAELAKMKGEHEPDVISEVFDWYLLHVGEEFVPEAFCGDSFRKKFDGINKALRRLKKKSEGKQSGNGSTKSTKLSWQEEQDQRAQEEHETKHCMFCGDPGNMHKMSYTDEFERYFHWRCLEKLPQDRIDVAAIQKEFSKDESDEKPSKIVPYPLPGRPLDRKA